MNHFVCSLPFLAEVNVRPKGMMVARPWDHSRSFGIPVVTVTKPSNSYVPEGTTVLIPTYGLQRNPRYFAPLADIFVPERWLPTSKQLELEPAIFKDQSKVVQNLDAFMPFSAGPANCVGKNLALMEMRMVVCLIMQKYDMRFEDGFHPKQWEDDIHDFFITLKGRLPVVLTPRK